jgi:hypothetical protein
MAKFKVSYWLHKQLAEGNENRTADLIVSDPSQLSSLLAHKDLKEFHVVLDAQKSRSHKKKSAVAPVSSSASKE